MVQFVKQIKYKTVEETKNNLWKISKWLFISSYTKHTSKRCTTSAQTIPNISLVTIDMDGISDFYL